MSSKLKKKKKTGGGGGDGDGDGGKTPRDGVDKKKAKSETKAASAANVHSDDVLKTEEEIEDMHICAMLDEMDDVDEVSFGVEEIQRVQQLCEYLLKDINSSELSLIKESATMIKETFRLRLQSKRTNASDKRSAVGQIRKVGGLEAIAELMSLYFCLAEEDGGGGPIALKELASAMKDMAEKDMFLSELSMNTIVGLPFSRYIVGKNQNPKCGNYIYLSDKIKLMKIVSFMSVEGRSQRNKDTVEEMERLSGSVELLVYIGKTIQSLLDRQAGGYEGNICLEALDSSVGASVTRTNLFFEANKKMSDLIVSKSLVSFVCLVGEFTLSFLTMGGSIKGNNGSMNKIDCGVDCQEPFIFSLFYLLESEAHDGDQDHRDAHWGNCDGGSTVFFLDFELLDSQSEKYHLGKSHNLKQKLLRVGALAVLPLDRSPAEIALDITSDAKKKSDFYAQGRGSSIAGYREGLISKNVIPFYINGFGKDSDPLNLPKFTKNAPTQFEAKGIKAGETYETLAKEIVDAYVDATDSSDLVGKAEQKVLNLAESWAYNLCYHCALNPDKLANDIVIEYRGRKDVKTIEQSANEAWDGDAFDLILNMVAKTKNKKKMVPGGPK